MSNVVKEKRKPLLSRVIGRIKVSSSHGQEGVASDVPLDDVRTDGEDIVTIASRRSEIRKAIHGNTDAMVTFDMNNI